jgi:hypothetical protein
MKTKLIYLIASSLAIILNANLAIADDSGSKPIGWSALDTSTPASPGAKIIGFTGEIGSVGTPNELAVKLLNGLNSDGGFQPTIAIDVAPYLLIRGTDFTLSEYREKTSGFKRFLASTKISIAANSKSDTGGRLGLGAEFILLNEGDPRLDDILINEFDAILSDQPSPTSLKRFLPANVVIANPATGQIIATDEQKKDAEKQRDEADKIRFKQYDDAKKIDLEKAKTRAVARASQKSLWTVGVGTSLVSNTGKYFDFRGDGTGVWTTYRIGMGGTSELILHGYYRTGEKTVDRNINGGFVNVDTLTTAARIRTGNDDFKFSIETAYNLENQNGKSSNSYFSFGLGVEPKITKDLWLSLSMDGKVGRQNGDDIQVFSGLKWNFNNGK